MAKTIISPNESFRQIPLTRGLFAIVDEEYYIALSKYKWHADRDGYAVRAISPPKEGEKRIRKFIRMHREIIPIPRGMEPDHINGNKSDNRKSNLRVCTASENCRNRGKMKKGFYSQYKGITYCKDRKKWKAYITVNQKAIFLGYYDNEKEAALTYNQAALKHHKEFARLNVIL